MRYSNHITGTEEQDWYLWMLVYTCFVTSDFSMICVFILFFFQLLAMKKPCPRFDEEERKLNDSPMIRKINDDNKKMYDYLTNHTGKLINCVKELEYLYDTLYIEVILEFSASVDNRSYCGQTYKYASKSYLSVAVFM